MFALKPQQNTFIGSMSKKQDASQSTSTERTPQFTIFSGLALYSNNPIASQTTIVYVINGAGSSQT